MWRACKASICSVVKVAYVVDEDAAAAFCFHLAEEVHGAALIRLEQTELDDGMEIERELGVLPGARVIAQKKQTYCLLG